jgi:hypothetical protein
MTFIDRRSWRTPLIACAVYGAIGIGIGTIETWLSPDELNS